MTISDTDVVLDGTVYGGMKIVVNHGFDPNVAYVVHRLPDCTVDVVFLEAMRPRAAGEELLADKGWSLSERNKPVICE